MKSANKTQHANSSHQGSQFGAAHQTTSQFGHQQANNQQVIVIQKGNFFTELERLKCLDNHRQRLDKIQQKDARKAVKASVERNDPKKSENDKRRRQDFQQNRKMEELTKENAKILQKIVEARQINVKARHKLVNTIKKDEDRSRSVRDAMARASVRRQSEIAMDNQRIAVKLFTQKPTYELLKFEKAHKQHKERVSRVSKMAKLNIGTNANLLSIQEKPSKADLLFRQKSMESTVLPPIQGTHGGFVPNQPATVQALTENSVMATAEHDTIRAEAEAIDMRNDDSLEGSPVQKLKSQSRASRKQPGRHSMVNRSAQVASASQKGGAHSRQHMFDSQPKTSQRTSLYDNQQQFGVSQSMQSPPSTLKFMRKRNQEQHGPNSRYVNPQAIQLSPGFVMGSQVSSRQKKDLAKYYTNLLGSKDQSSVNAYMQVSHDGNAAIGDKKKRKRIKKKRAVSHAAGSKLRNVDSQKNMLTIEQDQMQQRDQDDYGMVTNPVTQGNDTDEQVMPHALVSEGSRPQISESRSDLQNNEDKQYMDIEEANLAVDNQSAL